MLCYCHELEEKTLCFIQGNDFSIYICHTTPNSYLDMEIASSFHVSLLNLDICVW